MTKAKTRYILLNYQYNFRFLFEANSELGLASNPEEEEEACTLISTACWAILL